MGGTAVEIDTRADMGGVSLVKFRRPDESGRRGVVVAICIKIDEFCIKNHGFCISLCQKSWILYQKMMI